MLRLSWVDDVWKQHPLSCFLLLHCGTVVSSWLHVEDLLLQFCSMFNAYCLKSRKGVIETISGMFANSSKGHLNVSLNCAWWSPSDVTAARLEAVGRASTWLWRWSILGVAWQNWSHLNWKWKCKSMRHGLTGRGQNCQWKSPNSVTNYQMTLCCDHSLAVLCSVISPWAWTWTCSSDWTSEKPITCSEVSSSEVYNFNNCWHWAFGNSLKSNLTTDWKSHRTTPWSALLHHCSNLRS